MKLDTQPTARLEARLPLEVMARLKRAAEIRGRTLTDFVVAAADEAAGPRTLVLPLATAQKAMRARFPDSQPGPART